MGGQTRLRATRLADSLCKTPAFPPSIRLSIILPALPDKRHLSAIEINAASGGDLSKSPNDHSSLSSSACRTMAEGVFEWFLVKNNLYPTGFGFISAVLIKLAFRFPLCLVVYGPCTDSDIRMSGKKDSDIESEK